MRISALPFASHGVRLSQHPDTKQFRNEHAYEVPYELKRSQYPKAEKMLLNADAGKREIWLVTGPRFVLECRSSTLPLLRADAVNCRLIFRNGNDMDVNKLLNDVKSGAMPVDEAAELLKKLPYEDLGFAMLDHHRQIRSGFGEVIFCSGKSDEHLVKIYETFYQKNAQVLGTRASQHQYELVKARIPEIVYDPVSGILKIDGPKKEGIGRIAVCTAGTADIAVAEEAAQVAEYFGGHVDRFYDVGVAGIHRLFARIDEIRKANCVISIAGMEGALAGVIAGLVEAPVIAVPTSVGYGANFGGLSALLTMLNSCSNGITVVNIDNGYGAGYVATQINRLACKVPRKQ